MKDKPLVMVADDDAGILNVVQLILEDEGFSVVTVSNGATRTRVEEVQPDVLLLDIWMSGQDGQEICTYLKSRKSTQHIPIVMVSANRDTAEKAMACGADDFLTKPFDIDELVEKVRKFIQI